MSKFGVLVGSFLVACVGISGCGGGGSSSSKSSTSNATPTLISVVVTSAGSATSVAAGGTLQMTAKGNYSDGTTSTLTSQVSWKTSDTTLGTTSASGLLTAVKAGTIVVTATDGTVAGTMLLTVTPAALTSIAVTGGSSLLAGGNEQLAAQGTYADSTSQSVTSQATWQSSDTSVATVNGQGVLTAVSAGAAVITASIGSISGTISVSVTANAITLSSITVGATTITPASGSSEQLTALGTYSDNSTQSLTSLATWQSSNTSIATVSGGGLLTAIKAGTTTITATSGTVSGTLLITVNTPSLTSISILPSVFTVGSGQAKQLAAQGVYSDGTSKDVTAQATWGSSASNVASVSAAGLAAGVSPGTATISATIGSTSGTAAATVTAATLNSIVVTPSTASIAMGQTQAFAANGIFSDGSSTDITNAVNWSSDTTNVATVDVTGLATGVATGAATISANSGSATPGTAALTVTAAVLSSIDISPDGQYIPTGGQYQLTVTGTYSDNTTQDLTNATWSSSDPTLASIDPVSGIVTGVANSNGNPVTITATAGGQSTTTTVYVTAAVGESLVVTPATTSIASGTTVQYSVNEVYSDGTIQPVTAGLLWASSSAANAVVDVNGLATGIAPGQSTITVSYGSLSGSTTLTVTAATLTSIVVTPSSSVVGVNGVVQYTATGVFTDSSTQDLTSLATWSSSASNVALIDSTGLASALTTGTSTISATYLGISGSSTLTVSTATLVSISITPANPVVPPHAKIQLTAIGVFSDGSQIKLSGVSWHTSSAKYAMISGSGVLRTKKSSSKAVTVTAKLNGISGQTSVTITSMSVTSLSLTPATPTIALGTTLPMHLIGTFSDGLTTVDLTKSARWQTSNYHDAVIDRSGLVSGIAAGTTTITGIYGNLTPATATLTVTSATIKSITVSPNAFTIILGSLEQFSAAGLFSDGSTQDITTSSQWTSSSPAIAVINATSGLATSASHGQTNINATFKGVTGTTLLTVN